MKKATLIEKGKISYLNYLDAEGSFCLINPVKDNKLEKQFIQINNWRGCREQFIGELKRFHRGVWPHTHIPQTDKARIGMLFTDKSYQNSKENIKVSMKMVHFMENYMELPPTEAYETSPNGYRSIFAFEGSNKWIHAPQLLSLYLLCMRFGILREFVKDVKIESFKDIENIGDILNGKMRVIDSKPVRGTAVNFLRTYKHWKTFADNYRTLFLKRLARTNFNLNKETNGIYYLVAGVSDKVTVNRWCNLVRESSK